jgi:pyruvate kinase
MYARFCPYCFLKYVWMHESHSCVCLLFHKCVFFTVYFYLHASQYHSADAVMLSAESAAGKYPIESVTMQQQVINTVESDAGFRRILDRLAAEGGTGPAGILGTPGGKTDSSSAASNKDERQQRADAAAAAAAVVGNNQKKHSISNAITFAARQVGTLLHILFCL